MQFAVPLLAMAALASASWAQMSDEELVERSEVIVLATLAESDIPGSFGSLQVRDVLKGDVSGRLILSGRPKLASSDTLSYRAGQSGLWFLRAAPDGHASMYLADHPQRFEPDVSTREFWKSLVSARTK